VIINGIGGRIMSNEGLLVLIAEEARITTEKAFGALSATFQGLLDISSPETHEENPIEIYIVVNPPAPPHAKKKRPPRLRDSVELIQYISKSADISIEAAGAALGVITQAIIENGQDAGLRAYYKYDPD
jgi:hypothetical protein